MAEPDPICDLGSRTDVRHIVEVENIIKTYDLKVTCSGFMTNHQGYVRFECSTDGRVTDAVWPHTTKWIRPQDREQFCHVALRSVAPGSERVDVEVEIGTVGGWLGEDFPALLTIHVTGILEDH